MASERTNHPQLFTKPLMIVKVQLSQFPYHQDVLIYNEDKSVMEQLAITKEVLEVMDGEEKKYFLAHLQKDKKVKNGVYVVLDKEVGRQPW